MTKKHANRSSMRILSRNYYFDRKLNETIKAIVGRKNRTLYRMESQQENDTTPVDKSPKQSLSELIEDLHGQCESLYAHYDHLTTEDRNKKPHTHHEHQEEASSSSSDTVSVSDSDSDLDLDLDSDLDRSLHHKRNTDSNPKNEMNTATEKLERELEAAIMEIADLKNQLAAQGPRTPRREGSEKTIQDLREQLERLKKENEELPQLRERHVRESEDLQGNLSVSDARVTKLSEEKMRLRTRVSELENVVRQREDEVSMLSGKLDDAENEASSKIMTLIAELSNLKEVLRRAQTQKEQLEVQIRKEKLQSKEQLRKMKELQETVDRKSEQYQQLKQQVTDGLSKIADLESHIEDLKIDLEAAEDEAATTKEKARAIEVQLRLTNQKLKIAEQIKGDGQTSEEQEQECELLLLRDRMSKLEQMLAAKNEVSKKMIFDVSRAVHNLFVDMDRVVRRFNEAHGKLSDRIVRTGNQVQSLKQLTAAKNAQTQHENCQLVEQLQNERQHGLVLKQEICQLGEQLQDERRHGLVLEQEICQLRDEKREAIRQLCLWCDQLQSQNDEIKSIIVSNAPIHRQQNR